MIPRPVHRLLPLICACLAALPAVWLAFGNLDLPQFGKYQDDGLLFVGARSLHEGAGYRIASLPGKPFQTKYPPLYPALLSAIWTGNSQFPENLKALAVAEFLTAAAFLWAAVLLFRSFRFSTPETAMMFAFLVLSPWLMYWAAIPTSDFLFAALTIGFFLAFRMERRSTKWLVAAGCLGAAACLTKVAGVLIVPAILWSRRKQIRSAVLVALPIVAAFAGWSVWANAHRLSSASSVVWYYTDYVGFFTKNGGLAALPQILQSNVLSLIATVGNSLLYNLADSMPGRFLSVLVLAAGVSGTRRFVKRTGSSEYAVFSLLLVALLLIWNFSPNARLLAPAMPMLAIGLCEEGKHIYALIRRSAESAKSSDRIASRVVVSFLFAAMICAAILNANFIAREIPPLLSQDRATLASERAAFAWCKRNLAPSSVVLAANDTYLFLDTGLAAVRPVPNSVAFYRQDTAAEIENFTHLDELASFFGLTHVILTSADFSDFDPDQQKTILAAFDRNPRMKQIYSQGEIRVLEIAPASAKFSASR